MEFRSHYQEISISESSNVEFNQIYSMAPIYKVFEKEEKRMNIFSSSSVLFGKTIA